MSVKYAELFCDWLLELGYTHCFFVAGGAAMHLLDGARKRFTCTPVVHEVAAGIAAEYFNETTATGHAFALVTAGPGLTNIVTAVASAWLESRELLVVGGQVKRADLATNGIRQRGIQEVDGRALVAPITKISGRIDEPWLRSRVVDAVLAGRRERHGPVFLEMCLDVQGAPVERAAYEDSRGVPWSGAGREAIALAASAAPRIAQLLNGSSRPLILLGGGVSRAAAAEVSGALHAMGIPVMTTWNAADRVDYDRPYYTGRPNTWGERSANVILRQADCLLAIGTRLGIQQTGFNWPEFARDAYVIQVDIDRAELRKGHPRVDLPVACDADTLVRLLVTHAYAGHGAWLDFVRDVRDALPRDEPENVTAPGFLSPYAFYRQLSQRARPGDNFIPCSSGGANFTAMQAMDQRGQTIVTDKGLASMGIGLAGAIGAAFAKRDRRTILVEGDGGFIQNMQELATVAVNDLDIKIFLFANDGYASIRSSQRNYFDGAYIGCDIASGLGFPKWEPLFAAFGIPLVTLDERGLDAPEAMRALECRGAHGFIVPIDPEQTYLPKITSRITALGSMESSPLHLMTPELSPDRAARVFRHLEAFERV